MTPDPAPITADDYRRHAVRWLEHAIDRQVPASTAVRQALILLHRADQLDTRP